jgi:pimeloyl-ACP methyl ester carboxylesterase
METKFDYQGSRIAYKSLGTGRPVILLHGFGEDSRVWEQQVAILQEDHKLLIPDLPGSGSSELISDMSIEGMADMVKAVLDNEMEKEEGPVDMIGHSMGGYIALAFLEKYPSLLNSLGLFHSTAYADTEEKKAARRKSIAFIKDKGAFEFLKTAIPNLFSPLSRQNMATEIESFIDQQRSFTAEALVAYYEAMIGRPDRRSLLVNSKIPFLFVMGKYDTAVPFSDSLEQCHLPEIAYIHILRESAHMGMMEETNLANRILKNFLSQVQSPR